MRREELTGPIKELYNKKRGCGVTKVDREGYENIWFVVPPAPPQNLPSKLPAGVMGKANMLLQARPHWSKASPIDKLTAYLFARREAVESSRMEGTWSTIDHVLTPGAVHDEGNHKSENQSVRGYAAAIEYGFDEVEKRGEKAFTPAFVCKLHKLVMGKDPHFKGVAGRIRTPGLPGDVVQIGGGGRKEDSIYNPAPPTHVEGCLAETMHWMRDKTILEMGDAGMGLTLPVRMAIGHTHFEAVHPFSDGNGRIGRILWPLQMVAGGYLPLYLSGYVEQNRATYSQALQAAQKKLSYGPVVDFICKSIIASSEEELITKSVILGLPEKWSERGGFRKGSSTLKTLNVIIQMPIITASILAKELDVSFQTASTTLNALTNAGIMRERTGYGRNRVFAAEEVISVLSRKFGEDPDIALEGAKAMLEKTSQKLK